MVLASWLSDTVPPQHGGVARVSLLAAMPAAYRGLPRGMVALLSAGATVLVLLVLLSATLDPAFAPLLARAELTAASAIAVVAAGLSVHGTTGRTRRVRAWITLAIGLWLTAEIVRDTEFALDLTPVLSPSHLPFAGVLLCAGFAYAAALGGQLGRSEEAAVYLDGAIVFFTTASVLLTTFGSQAGSSLPAALDLAYAIFFMATTGATLLLDVAIRAERRANGAYVVLAGLVLLGAGFLWRVVDPPAVAGSHAGAEVHLLSLGVFVVMLGTITWTDAVDADPGYVRFAERLRTAMPLVAIGITPVIIVFQFFNDLPAPLDAMARAAIALVLVSVAARQSVLLTDRERAVRRERQLGRELAKAEAKYRALVEQQPAALYLAEPGVQGRWHYVSPQIEQLLGYPAQAWLDDPTLWASSIHPDDRDEILGQEGQLTVQRPSGLIRREYRLRAADGRDVWVLDDDSVTERADDGTPTLVQGLLLDITERKHAEAALRVNEQQTRMIIETASYAFIGMDTSGRVIDWNQRSADTFGWTAEEAIGSLLADLIIPEPQRTAHTDGLARYLSTGEGPLLGQRVQVQALHRDGHELPVEITIWPIELDDEVRFNALVDDITIRKQLEDELRHQALHDALTGLPNRALFIDRLEHALERASRVPGTGIAVLFVDLDDFKAVNDSLGHEAGDAVIQAVAKRVSRTLRAEDTAARLSGDEFAVLLEDTPDGRPQTVAARIQKELSRPLDVLGRSLSLQCSIGIALSGEHGTMPDELLRNSDLAMYLAKARGKNRHEVYETGMHEAAVRRLEMRRGLEHAVAAGALEVQYQPIASLADGSVVGLEALLRWRGPDGQFVPVPEIIAMAEATGLILPIGRFVMETACRDTRRWQEEFGLEGALDIAVNVSIRQLEDGTLMDDVTRALARSGLSASSLVLEITESALASDSLDTVRTIRSLRSHGVRLALDDFGTGYSSLARLRRFPVDVVKIDRSFVMAMGRDREGVLVQSIIDLGRSLDMEVVAEGIETLAQLTALRARGAELGQGYYLAKPMPAEAIAVVLEVGKLPLPRRARRATEGPRARHRRIVASRSDGMLRP